MTLTIDPTITDLNEWVADLSMVDDWLYTMWGIVPGAGKPARTFGRVHPSSVATAGWLNTLFGFAV
jgi:phage-related minor tail protein